MVTRENIYEKQFEMYFSLGTLIGYMHDNKLIATGGVFPFKDSFSTIGMLIVHPDFQGQGIGRTLLNHCLAHTHPKQPIALIATKAGEPLYTSCGFQTVTTIHRFEKQTTKTHITHTQQVKEKTLYRLFLSIKVQLVPIVLYCIHYYYQEQVTLLKLRDITV